MGWGPDVRDIATCLREYGAEFRVCIRDRVYANPRPPNLSEYTGLGFRKENYTPTVVDYRVYVAQLTDFLRSERGVLALQAGGILGRLAKFAVNTNLMCLRPGPDVFRTGIRLWDGRSSTAYWDNCLTMDEINLICGVYEIGTVTDVKQTTQISWWPKPAMFEKSGMNIGWWSADCERWFLAREALIKENRAKLYTSKEWKSGLRFFTQPHKIAVSNERICAEFLEKKLGGV
ncbi:hypothetical protein B0H16DRAFT_1307131 [Mycena metata]|uniref:Uncharacterized protein n=1 Tax=Mycena metata TaxID=1033252 RepID=A0AAD7JQT2_9AGAR|nr:hypothetical protein B0H16DRAFT_1325315 [Mycena metata]KAJ7769996.1 hypothetical protein B0H16DRAFT_1307131 [Mycena metata]